MKNSQIVVVSVAGFLTLIMIVMAGLGRVALSQSVSGTTRAEASSTVVVGEQITETFDLKDFQGVDVEGVWRVSLTQGDEWQVEVSHPASLEGDVKVRVQGDRLILGRTSSGRWRWWGRNETRLSADIVMPELNELDLAGASTLELSGFEGERLEVDIAGAVRIEGRDGRYDVLELSVAGASEIDLRGIVVTDARVDLAGASDVTLSMNGGVLSGSMAGAGVIDYYGTVAEQRVRIAGVGHVRRVD